MAVFNPIVITTAGISLLSQAMAGKGTLTFTSVATSTTVIPYNISNIQAMTALSGIVQTVVPVSVVLKTGNVQVSSIFNNAGITNAYTANTIGLYAALGNGAQTLFAVAIATTPDNIPVQNDLSPSNFYYQFNIAISDTSQLTVTVPEDGSLPASVFNQMFPGITAPDQNNDGDALVYNASSGAWGYVNTETVFTTVSGSGEFVSLQKTLADDFKQIQLFGKSVQKPTTGAQLFNINKLKELDDGVEIIDYSTGEMEISQQNNAMLSVRLSDICPNMVEGRTYYLTGETTSNNKYLRVGAKQWNFDESFVPEESDLLAQCNFVCTTQTGQSGEIIYYKDTFKHIMIVEGSTEKPYEVYTGGEAATEPSPEYPLPIQSVGIKTSDGYEVPINVTGNQLFDASKIPTTSAGGATVTNNGDGSFTVSGSGNLDSSFSVFFTYDSDLALKLLFPGVCKLLNNSSDNINPYFTFGVYSIKGLVIAILDSRLNKSIQISKSIIDGISCGKYQLRAYFYGSSGTPISPGYIKPMVYQSGDGLWEPFITPLQTSFIIQNPLYGVPMASGGNYTDNSGQQWGSSFIDGTQKKIKEGCGVIIFDGVTDGKKLTKTDANTGTGYNYAYITGTGILNKSFAIGSRLNYIGNSILYENGIIVSSVLSIMLSDDITGVGPSDSTDTIVSKINAVLNQWFLDGAPLVVVYQLASPTSTPLTPDQISALEALQTFNPNTAIFSGTYPAAGLSVTAQGFNIAGDLAQNMMALQGTVQTQADEIETLQGTVQSQGTAIAANTTKLSTFGLIGYGTQSGPETGQTLSMASFVPNWPDVFTSGALYSVFFSVTFSVSSSGGVAFQPYIMQSIRTGLSTSVTQLPLPPVYQANTGNTIPYACTFMIETDADQDVSDLEFQVDTGSHDFTNAVAMIYRVR